MQSKTNSNSISIPFTFDGKSCSRGSVRLLISQCEVEGAGFLLPAQYGLLLLSEQTALEAKNLLQELMAMPLSENIKSRLVTQACECGIGSVAIQIKQYKQHIPTSTPAFYAPSDYPQQQSQYPYGSFIFLVNDKKAFCFYVSKNLKPTLAQLPPSVYRSCLQHTSFELNLSQYQQLLGREGEFFVFVEKLYQCMAYIRGDGCWVCYDKFFEDASQAGVMLGALCGRVGSRDRRDELFRTFESRGFLEVSGGLFVHCVWLNYFVSNNGEVHQLKYAKKVEEREAVLRAHEKGKLPTKMVPVEDSRVLRSVAEVVGKVRPELALIILP